MASSTDSGTGQQTLTIFNKVKDGAESLLKNIKGSSSKGIGGAQT